MALPRASVRKARRKKAVRRQERRTEVRDARAKKRIENIENGTAFGQRIAGALAGAVEGTAGAVAGGTYQSSRETADEGGGVVKAASEALMRPVLAGLPVGLVVIVGGIVAYLAMRGR